MYIFDLKQKTKREKNKKRKKKAKETKEEKGISVEIFTGYDDIVCEFSQCAFNLLDRVVNFSW